LGERDKGRATDRERERDICVDACVYNTIMYVYVFNYAHIYIYMHIEIYIHVYICLCIDTHIESYVHCLPPIHKDHVHQ